MHFCRELLTDRSSHFLLHGVETTDTAEMADMFNNYFVDVADKLKNDIPPVQLSPLHYINADMTNSFLTPVTESECTSLILKLKNVSSGKNSPPVKLLT